MAKKKQKHAQNAVNVYGNENKFEIVEFDGKPKEPEKTIVITIKVKSS
jgi:hypothetical protein